MRNMLVFGLLALAAIVWTGVSAQQEMLPRPGPGSGVTPVSGTVSISALPDIEASQRGEWRVGITDLPEVRVAAPSFVRPGSRYKITWTNGDEEDVTVTAAGQDGWVQIAHPRSRWLNLKNARSVDSLP